MGRVNLVQGHVKTQLIAHDKEVYDIAFSRAGGGRDIFASVGQFFYSFIFGIRGGYQYGLRLHSLSRFVYFIANCLFELLGFK